MDLRKLKTLIDLVSESNVSELEIEIEETDSSISVAISVVSQDRSEIGRNRGLAAATLR